MLEGRFLAAVKACGPGAVLSHYTAGALSEMVDWDGRVIEVLVPCAGPRLHPGIKVHRTTWLERKDVRSLHGIPVTAPARTLLDLMVPLGPKGARRALRQAQSRNLVNVRALADLLSRAGRRRGVRMLAKLIGDGPVPTRSELEDVVLDLILAGGLERPEINKPISVGGRRVIPDFRWPEQRLVVEADGAAWHDSTAAREEDAERQALLEAHGERVVRVRWLQAVTRPTETVTRLVRAGAPTVE